MKAGRFWAWVVFALGAAYFFIPLIATVEFSMRMRRGVYSFDAYKVVLGDARFQATFGYSVLAAIFTIILGVLIVVPAAYWIRLRLPQLRPVVEFITLLPLVIPAIVIVFGYIRMYGSNSPLPFLATDTGFTSPIASGTALTPGTAVVWRYTVRNTGSGTVTGMSLTDVATDVRTDVGGTTTATTSPTITCPGYPPATTVTGMTLAAGASIACTSQSRTIGGS